MTTKTSKPIAIENAQEAARLYAVGALNEEPTFKSDAARERFETDLASYRRQFAREVR